MFEKVLSKISELAGNHLGFLKQAFSDKGQPSSSRLLTFLHSIVACFSLVYIIFRSPTHTVDGAVATGLGGFATVHYGVNRLSNMFGQKKDKDSDSTPEAPVTPKTP